MLMNSLIGRIAATITVLLGTGVAVAPATAASAAIGCEAPYTASSRGRDVAVDAPVTNPGGAGRRGGAGCLGTQQPAVIAEPELVTIPEGATGSFSVRLSQAPTRTVPLFMSMSGTGIWASPPILLVFTPSNWNVPQSYSVASMPD